MVNGGINYEDGLLQLSPVIAREVSCVFRARDYVLSHGIAVPAHVRVQVELRQVVTEASGGQTGSHGPAIIFQKRQRN